MQIIQINKSKLKCPRCHRDMIPAVSMRGMTCRDWVRCSDNNCMTFIQTKVPLYHQAQILQDPHRELGVFGGYGSGKTVAGYLGDEKHIMLTPNGETLVGADTLVQINNTVRKDLESDFPAEFVRAYNRQQNQVLFENGHILHYRHLAEPDDLRSYNVSRIHILEGSECKHESYTQLQTRLRNEAAIVPFYNDDGSKRYVWNQEEMTLELDVNYDWLQMVIESNPDSGWIKYDILEKSHVITIYDSERVKVEPNDHIDNFKSSHVIPTRANYMLPPSFYYAMVAGKPDWWKRRYIEGSFDYAEGLVYPNMTDRIVDDFDIPRHWQRLIGFDYGLNANSHFVFGAMDWFGEHKKNGVPALYWFTEVVVNNANIKTLAEMYKRKYREAVPALGSMYRTPVMDGRSYYVRAKVGAKETLGKLFLDQGVLFNPAEMDLSARIFRTTWLIDEHHCYFFKGGVPKLIREYKEYKYPDKQLEKNTASDKPIDKRNHGINATEFAHMQLPGDLKPTADFKEDYRRNRPDKPLTYNPFADLDKHVDEYEQSDGFGSLFHEL